MQEYHRQAGRLLRDLVEHIGVIHMRGGTRAGGVIIRHVKGAVRGDDRTACGEDALVGDRKRAGVVGCGVLAAGGCAAAPCEQGERQGAGERQRDQSAVGFHVILPFCMDLGELVYFSAAPPLKAWPTALPSSR